MIDTTIHIAYAISRRGGTTYRARAYVLTKNTKYSFVVALGDTANEAMADAVRRIERMWAKDNLRIPEKSIVYHGKMPSAIIDNYLF